MVGKNHATVLHCTKVVNNAMHYRDVQYVDEINKWALIFDEVMPNSNETKDEVADTISDLLLNSMLDRKNKKDVLRMVLKKINNVYVSN
jgi:hypothetical protein